MVRIQNAPPGQQAGVLFAFDVTDAPTYSTINDHPTNGSIADPHGWTLRAALSKSAASARPFLVSPALPDSRMRAQEGLFIASAVPYKPGLPGVDGLTLASSTTVGVERLHTLFTEPSRTQGRPLSVPFCAIIIPRPVKEKMRDHLAATYNRTERSLFPDIAGFREAWNSKRIDVTEREDVIEAQLDVDART